MNPTEIIPPPPSSFREYTLCDLVEKGLVDPVIIENGKGE